MRVVKRVVDFSSIFFRGALTARSAADAERSRARSGEIPLPLRPLSKSRWGTQEALLLHLGGVVVFADSEQKGGQAEEDATAQHCYALHNHGGFAEWAHLDRTTKMGARSGAGVSPASPGVPPAWSFAGETPALAAGTAAPLSGL